MTLLTRRDFLKLIGPASVWASLGWPCAAVRAETAPPDLNIRFSVNGRPVTFRSGRELSLLDFLRGDLGLKGAKYGCGVGVCGACTVLIDGRPIRSCLVNVEYLSGYKVTTVEGLGGSGALDPVQKIFADLGVFQCGYCAPGFMMTARALLDRTPHPTPAQIREALYGNLCRCTGYLRIIEAVRAVNDPDLFGHLLKRPHSGVGGGPVDLLAEPKVTGRLAFAGDHDRPGQLHARVVWSAHAHAVIRDIDTKAAVKTAGVIRVLTHKDLPGRRTFGSVVQDQPVLAGERVRFFGDAVAVVVAASPAAARKGADRVRISYEPLPGVFGPKEALRPEAPSLTDKGNICCTSEYAKGSIEDGRRRAAVTIIRTYRTPFVEHAYLETESCLTHIDENGYLIVTTASQAPHSYRDQIAAVCGLSQDRVRLQTTVAGGAFGGKGDLTIQHLCALATVATGRPVRLELTREESMRVHVKRHPFTLVYETGADSSGRLTHCAVEGLADVGAYNSASLVVVDDAATFATGPYQIDHISVKMTGAFTNNPTCGAMRGFGVPQVCLAMERQMDELAAGLEMDPLEFRLKNALDEGNVAQWGQIMGPGVGVKACLEALGSSAREAKREAEVFPDEKLGLGFAACYKNASTPTYLPFGRADVHFSLDYQGRLRIYVGSSELGQGLATALARIATVSIGAPVDRIDVVFGSTGRTESPVLTTSSQATFLTGGAVAEGGRRFRRQLIETAAEILGITVEDLSIGSDGVVGPDGKRTAITYHELAWRSRLTGRDPTLSYTYTPDIKNIEPPKQVEKIGPDQAILPSLAYGAQAALVAVNVKTGRPRIIKILAAHDVGRAVNPAAIEGQIQGGVVMGLGWCLKEHFKIEQGRVITDNLDTYFIPRSKDIPEIEVLIVEVPDPVHPLGVKGLGELPLLPTAPAVLNALKDAVGIGLDEIPLSIEKFKQKLRQIG